MEQKTAGDIKNHIPKGFDNITAFSGFFDNCFGTEYSMLKPNIFFFFGSNNRRVGYE